MTNFPNGLASMGVPVMGMMTQGNSYFVAPRTGNDGNTGKTMQAPLKTVAAALALATANQNDVIYLVAEGNTAANTTDYQSTTLIWNKDGVHLIGINGNPRMGHRSRIALISTYDTASNLMTVSANGCYFANLEIFEGVAGTNPTGCLKVTGVRNHFQNCQIAGIGNNANDIADAYSVALIGNASENYFEKCVIGCDTIARGSAANSEIYVATLAGARAARNIFENCVINGWCESAGNYTFLSAASGSIDRYMLFKDCAFINPGASVAGGAAMTYAMIVTSANGKVVLHNTSITGAADVADNPGTVVSNAPVVGAATDLSITQVVTKT